MREREVRTLPPFVRQGDPIPQVLVLGQQGTAYALRERLAVRVAGAGPLDRQRRIALEVLAQDGPLEEVPQDAQVLVGGPGFAVAVLEVQELLDALRPDGRREVREL
jgi:hypothetical protein